MPDPLSLFLESLSPSLNAAVEGEEPFQGRPLRAPSGTGFEWSVHLAGRQISLKHLEDAEEIGEMEVQKGFLNFQVADGEIWRRMADAVPPERIATSLSLRDAHCAAALKVSRQGLKEFRKRLAGLPERLESAEGGADPALSPQMRLLVAAQWQLLHRLAVTREPWAPAALGKALEHYLRALSPCWEQESIDAPGDPDRTKANLKLWASQKRMVEGLSKALRP